jgi:hypothetical protein
MVDEGTESGDGLGIPPVGRHQAPHRVGEGRAVEFVQVAQGQAATIRQLTCQFVLQPDASRSRVRASIQAGRHLWYGDNIAGTATTPRRYLEKVIDAIHD